MDKYLPAPYNFNHMKKLLLLILPLLLVFTGCGKPTLVPPSQRFCSLTKGFNLLAPGLVNRIGYITYLKIGTMECAADLTITDPENPANKVEVIGVVSWLSWNGGKADPVVFAAQVSAANKDTLATLGKTDLKGTDIQFAFALYDLDSVTGFYYQSLSSNNAMLQGRLHVENGHHLYYMSADSGVDVTEPVNYNFQLGVKPNDIQQKILAAEAAGKSQLQAWGKK
jgi:hypothetical protein